MCEDYACESDWVAEACFFIIIVICYVTISSSISEPDWAAKSWQIFSQRINKP